MLWIIELNAGNPKYKEIGARMKMCSFQSPTDYYTHYHKNVITREFGKIAGSNIILTLAKNPALYKYFVISKPTLEQ